MAFSEAKLSGDFTETETLKSILSNEDSTGDAATGWHPKEGKKRSEDIDRYLEAESAKLKRQLKVLVLGATEPKDVFWKQTSLLENPLTDNDREEMKSTIQKRVLQLARGTALELVDELKKGDAPPDTSKHKAAEVLRHALDCDEEDLDCGRKLDEIYNDPTFQSQLDQAKLSLRNTERGQLEMQHSMFLDNSNNTKLPLTDLLGRVLSKDYQPTDSDYVHFDNRRRSSYLHEAQIHRDTHLLRILDLHSGRGERKKWIHFFEDTKCVIFVVDLGTYCQSLMEDDGYSLLYESLLLFESVARSRWFFEIPVICVLSNVGAFKRKLKDKPLSKWFSDYQGKTEDEALQFLVDKHVNAVKGRPGVEVHVCDELSSSAVQAVIENMEKTALKDVLHKLGVTGGKVG